MAEVLKERNEIDPKYQWDLSDLYASDEAWEADFASIDGPIAELAAYQGKLKDAQVIAEFFAKQTALERRMMNLAEYGMLRRSEDTRASAAQKIYARGYAKYVEASTALAFAVPEILSLPEETLKALTEDPVLADYRYTMEQLIKKKPHTLTTAEETLLSNFGEVIGAPSEISENLMDADLVFENAKDSEGNEQEVTGSSYIELQMSQDRVLRESSFRSLYKTYRQHINTFAATYSAAVKAAAAEARVRHYGSSREMSMSENNIPVPVYDNLIAAVHRHLPAMYRYVALRKKILGLEEIHYYDVYAPLSSAPEKNYSYEEAKELVLGAVAPFGDRYTDVVREGFGQRWVDVYPNKGKRGGAYSAGTYDSRPYILCNFNGKLDSVSTIAHEMGHSMHSYFAKKAQPPQYADYTLFVAEVASTVNENLLIEKLLGEEKDPQVRLSLLNQYLENFKGTVYRQTMFAEFEKEAHAMAERGEALNAESLNKVYRGLIEKYFGPELVIDDEVQYEWARIPHFYRPFYVYVYATGYSTACALSEGILKEGESAVNRYIEFLSMGGSAYPLDELRHAGVDLDTPEPVDRALEKFERVLAEAEELAAVME